MIYFGTFYDFIENINDIKYIFPDLVIEKKFSKSVNTEYIIIFINKDSDFFKSIIDNYYDDLKKIIQNDKNLKNKNIHITKSEIKKILKNFHITLWRDPWIDCEGIFYLIGEMNNQLVKVWYTLNQKKKLEKNSMNYYVREADTNNCNRIYEENQKLNIDKNNEIYQKIYNKVKITFVDYFKEVIEYINQS